jgi:Ca2+-binding RTX toxin-like protein
MIKYFQALTVYLLFLVMTACGGSSSDSDKTAAVELITVFELIAQQEVFLDTLAEETDFSSTAINIGETKESATLFSIIRSTSINQITWLGVIDSSLPGEIKNPQFKINIYQDNNGEPNVDAVITISEVSQVKKMAVLNDKQTVYAFNINKSSLFDLAPNHYHISISLIADEDYTFFPLLNNESSVQQIRLAGACVGPCKLDQVGSDEDDVLIGDEFSNHFKGNKGDDYLVGSYGDDFYYFELGDGKDVISEFDSVYEQPRPEVAANDAEGTGDDSIVFMPGIEIDQLDFTREGLNLKISVYETEDELTLTNWFLDDTWQVEFLSFPILGRYDIRYQGFYESASYLSDWLGGDENSNTLHGLDWKDILSGRQGDDFLYGDSGDDLLIGGLGADVLDGGEDYDTASYHDSAQGILLYLDNRAQAKGGTAAGDTFESIEHIIASNFSDVIYGDDFNNTLTLLEGDDEVYGGSGSDIIYAGLGNDIIHGEAGTDILFGGEGSDHITGGTGQDEIFGGLGNDSIWGDKHDDVIDGGEGDDIIRGGTDQDVLSGGAGSDELYGESGRDELLGGSGDDQLLGGEGADYLNGGPGVDTLKGGTDNDILIAELGDDYLNGESGDDLLIAGEGDDILITGSGNNIIYGGPGNDQLEGGAEGDIYIFDGDFGQDTVTEDFTRSLDDALVFSKMKLTQLWFIEKNNDLIIKVLGTDNQVLLKNYSRFNIGSDFNGNALVAIQESVDEKTLLENMNFPIKNLTPESISTLVVIMAQYNEPTSVDTRPSELSQNNLYD